MKRTALAVIAAVALTVAVTTSLGHPIPSCQEDEILIGVGDFHAGGYWDSYDCHNIDLPLD